MASSSGTSSGSSLTQQEDLQTLIEKRKRKRTLSNRESARRSRMRKQKHLDDLMAQVSQLKKENDHMIASINLTTQHLFTAEADNSILRAQVGELSHRLQSLNEIIAMWNASNGFLGDSSLFNEPADFFLNPLNISYLNQPIMPSAAEVFQ
uniref:Uncharacterized protein MANES_04G074300 n=1 Tax=Rhizophora mucronata TaxID=61149 RepID=A0A2P2MXN0_RHIMU